MFGWFSPKCPVSTWEKTWTEVRMRWFAERFGIQRLQHAEVAVPADLEIDDIELGTVKYSRCLLERLCDFMDIDAQGIKLNVVEDVRLPQAAGQYKQRDGNTAVIRVAQSQLVDPQQLAATLAHELSHHLLLGGGLIDPAVADHEWVTDLLPVYLGVGIFAANATIQEKYAHDTSGSWWSIGKQGYLPPHIFGYAMALFAFVRDERSPHWANYLRPDAAAALKNGLRFLHKTEDTLFHPTKIGAHSLPHDTLSELANGTPSARLAALWQIKEQAWTSAECLEAVLRSLSDEDLDIVAEALRTLPHFGAAAEPAVAQIRRQLRNPDDVIRTAAAQALGTLRLQQEGVVHDLCAVLGEGSSTFFETTAWALGELGAPLDELSLRRLLSRLETALVDCKYAETELIARTLLAVASDAAKCIKEYFGPRDAELTRQALAALREVRLTAQKRGP